MKMSFEKKLTNGQAEQILMKQKLNEKIVEDDRYMPLFPARPAGGDTDSSLNAPQCPALSDLKFETKFL
jgi:hypothetical protein